MDIEAWHVRVRMRGACIASERPVNARLSVAGRAGQHHRRAACEATSLSHRSCSAVQCDAVQVQC